MLSKEELGQKIRCERKKKRLTPTQIETYYGIKRATLMGWETGRYYPSIEAVQTLCELFDYDVDVFLNAPYSEDAPKHREFADVHQITKLSDESIGILRDEIKPEPIILMNIVIKHLSKLWTLIDRQRVMKSIKEDYSNAIQWLEELGVLEELEERFPRYWFSFPTSEIYNELYKILSERDLFAQLICTDKELPFPSEKEIVDLPDWVKRTVSDMIIDAWYSEDIIAGISHSIQKEFDSILDTYNETVNERLEAQRKENLDVECEESH